MTDKITIHAIANNHHGARPRKPLVQLLASGEFDEVASITFHPDHAEAIAEAIRRAGNAAKAGRDIVEKTIDVREQH